MNINQETGEVEGLGRSPRFQYWVAFLVFSTIVMISSAEVVRLGFALSFCQLSYDCDWETKD